VLIKHIIPIDLLLLLVALEDGDNCLAMEDFSPEHQQLGRDGTKYLGNLACFSVLRRIWHQKLEDHAPLTKFCLKIGVMIAFKTNPFATGYNISSHRQQPQKYPFIALP